MKEVAKNVKLIFTDFKGCPSIDMPAVAYDRLVNEVFNNNTSRSIDFDEVAIRIRDILYNHVRECDEFSDWWVNHPTAGYYWRKGEMSIDISEGFVSRWIRISGLIKRSYEKETMDRMERINIGTTYSSGDIVLLAGLSTITIILMEFLEISVLIVENAWIMVRMVL